MSLIPNWRNKLPSFFKGATDVFNFDKLLSEFEQNTGLTISSDDKHVFVEADVPGLIAKDIDVSVDDNGMLWIKGDRKVEDKSKKFYKKSVSSFSYCVQLWDEIDTSVEPEASCKNGVMKITFTKKKEKVTESKKIPVKEEK